MSYGLNIEMHKQVSELSNSPSLALSLSGTYVLLALLSLLLYVPFLCSYPLLHYSLGLFFTAFFRFFPSALLRVTTAAQPFLHAKVVISIDIFMRFLEGDFFFFATHAVPTGKL